MRISDLLKVHNPLIVYNKGSTAQIQPPYSLTELDALKRPGGDGKTPHGESLNI